MLDKINKKIKGFLKDEQKQDKRMGNIWLVTFISLIIILTLMALFKVIFMGWICLFILVGSLFYFRFEILYSSFKLRIAIMSLVLFAIIFILYFFI